MQCPHTAAFLKTLVTVNQRAGVDPEVVDLIESFAILRLANNRDINFYTAARPISAGDAMLQIFLQKNLHLDERAKNFVTAYWQEMKASRLCCIFSCAHLADLLQTPLDLLHSLSRDQEKNYHIFI